MPLSNEITNANTKVTKELAAQRITLENMFRELNVHADVMDGIIENIYEIAASIREAGKEERLLEKELKMSLGDIKKLAKNWNKQKSVKLPGSKVVTKKQFDGYTKIAQACRRKVRSAKFIGHRQDTNHLAEHSAVGPKSTSRRYRTPDCSTCTDRVYAAEYNIIHVRRRTISIVDRDDVDVGVHRSNVCCHCFNL